MAGVKYIAKRRIQQTGGSNKDGHFFFKISLVYTDKPVRNVIQKYHVWDKLNEAICYQQILI